jgi:predicted small lipoprotein YifL
MKPIVLILLSIMTALSLSACGQSGRLYLPDSSKPNKVQSS